MKRLLVTLCVLLCVFAMAACGGAETSYPDIPVTFEPDCPIMAELMSDTPLRSVADAFHDALSALENGDRVLVFLLDGWGWEKFQYHRDMQPFLSSLNPEPALTVYPPITPVALATVVTGVQPDVHGIHSRADRRMNYGVTDIFAEAARLGRTVAYIQGHSGIIQTSLLPILSPDADGLYGSDNEIFENARRHLDADFLFVHFHGIDDMGHTYGPYAEEVGVRMALIDECIQYLVENWGYGTVIITADHGMRRIYGNPYRLGDHGNICHEDMIVPYIITQRGSSNE
ncbi:MAG: alkaline phosphatase family protein [Oscillospiraceae bacterium]|nr:alkaline phosphatase family protein [Oscillospiraceae bacterium]